MSTHVSWRRVLGLGSVAACLIGACVFVSPASAADATYVVKAGGQSKGATRTFEAENPDQNLRLEFSPEGLIASPKAEVEEPWSLDLRLNGISFEGQQAPLGTPKLSASGNSVSYDLGTASVRYLNIEGAVEQVFTVPVPAGTGNATLAINLSVGDSLTPTTGAYFVDLLNHDGDRVLRYGSIQATDANGKKLNGEIVAVPATESSPTGARIVVELTDAASPITVAAALRQPSDLVAAKNVALPPAPRVNPNPTEDVQISGVQIPMSPPVTETVDQIMERDKYNPPTLLARPRETHPEQEAELHRRDNPSAPISSRWPISFETDSTATGITPLSPQTVGTSFKGVNLAESGFIPPDSMGDIGPTQVLFHENGRIKVFNRTGTLGSLNATDLAFWTSVDGASQPSDPEVRYDRLTGRWIIMAMNTTNPNNKVMIAFTAPNATITGTASFTFTSFQGPLATAGGDGVFADCLLDYPSFGIDNNAIYVGGNMFCGAATASEAYVHSNLYVIPKSTLFGTANGGTVSATAFYNVNNNGVGPGPFAPMGVDSDDPQTTTGYFIGEDVAFFSQLDVIKVSNPGTTPTIGSVIQLVVPRTVNPILQASNGSTTLLDASDTRLIKASIHKNKVTGVSTLWSAHHMEVNTSGVATSGGGRNGARWYEISGSVPTTGDPLGGTVFLRQAGTLFDSTATNPKGYIYPSVAETGQGHMALGATSASNAASSFPSVSVAGRFRTDTLGAIQAPTVAVSGAASYTNVSNGRNRWGDYSFTDVDPLDDQTVWTFQEYADASNSWAVQAIQLKAPAPAAPASSSNIVCTGRASTNVTITGTSASGTEFFDPGPDTGGPGYTNHIAASLAGGTAPTVNSVTFIDPTHVRLNLNTTSATTGAKNVTITNPDGQTATGTGILTVTATCTASLSGTVTDAGTGLGINGATVTAKDLTTTTSSTGAYSFSSIPAGTYAMTVTAPGYSSGSANATVVDGQNTTQNFSLTLGVSDTAACSTDTSEVDFEAGTVSNLDTYSSAGNVLVPTTTAQTDQSNTAVVLSASTVSTTQWRAQSFVAGVTGNLTTVTFDGGSVTSAASVTVEVHNDSSNTPGTLITGATANTGTISTLSTVFTFTLNLGTAAPVVSGTRYWLVFKGSTSTLRGFITPSCTATCSTYANGNESLTTTSGGSWAAQNDDLSFVTYVIPTSTSGTLISSLKDANPSAGNTARWSLSWTAPANPANTTLQFQAAASNSPTGPFTFVGPGGSTGTFWTTSPVSAADMAQFNGFRYFEYKIIAGRTAQGVTPTVNDVTVCFTDGCQGAANGTSCNDGNPCTQTDTCQSNVCVGSNPVSCTAGSQCLFAATCNVGTGVCSSTTPKSSATLCTGSSQGGTCDNDAADHCTGTNASCVDVFQSSSFTCRNSAGQCDVAETCTGSSGACPADGFASSGTSCTGASQGGGCDNDAADHCSGTANTCIDVFQSSSFTCRASAGQCDVAELCTGSSGTCPSDGFASSGTSCTGSSQGGTCDNDAADHCSGTANTCVDVFQSSSFTCRASAGQCDVAELCTGSSGTCPTDVFASSGTSCTGSSQGGACDNDAADHCSGTANTCVDVFQSSSFTCRASAGQCDVAETCTGSSGTCPTDVFASSGTSCTGASQGGACDNDAADHCSGSANSCVDVFQSSSFVCRNSAGQCDVAETCTGSSGACPADAFASSGTSCTGASQGGACDNDSADHCSGTANTCVDVYRSSSFTCRSSAGECDPAETCTGSSGTCPADAKSPSGTACTNDGNPCTFDQCDGTHDACQHPNEDDGTTCDDGSSCTSGDVCTSGVCAGTAVACDDNNPCTDDTCDPATGCIYTNNTNPCNDGNACTSGDTCGGGVCNPGTPVVCNDNNPCTDDSCNPATGCVYTNNTNSCDDGNACTSGDVCSGGTCHSGTPVVCNDNNPCTDDTCNPATGCVYTNNTSPCSDGNACTFGDTCGGGVCHPGAPVVCNDNNPCTDDSCNPATGCVFTNNARPCDDGNACTDNDTCGGGVCNPGTPHVCNDNNPCTDDTCNPASGCVYTNNTSPCDDGNACTDNDTCGGGVCNPGTPHVCNDNNPCTDDSCNPATGCVYTNNTSPCDDGNACTTGDTCGGGVCNPGTAVVCNDNNVCTTDTCDPSSGCVYTNNTNPCSDGNACTAGDTCGGGTCHAGTPVVCNDNNPCTDDTCNPATGCVYTNNTSPCSDGNACTSGDVCGGGVCHPGTPVVCNDNNPCTDDSCNPATGCVYVNNTSPCSDGNACTFGDTCGGGVCNPGTPVVCNDNNPCTDDTCNPASGCVYTNNTAPCSDGNACTDNDTCGGGVCNPGTPHDCNDNNPCTDDTCNPATGCIYTNNTSSCNDGNACTTNDTCSGGVCSGSAIVCNDNNPCTDDTCNPATGCVYTNNTAPCNDGNACTTGDTCGGGTCHPGAAVVCNDNNPCTDDTCNPATGCVYTNNTAPCSDGNACTTGDTCGGGVCHPGAPTVCNDNNPCTDDTCNPATGCVYTNNTAPCNDGNACTTGDTCGGGTCHPGAAVVCNDNNPCTDDTCNPATGCVYTNNTAPCSDGNACTTGDTCGGGTCHPGSPTVCNDNNPCTDDSCNPASGCVFTNNTSPCNDGNACTTNDTCGGGTCHGGPALVCNDNNVCTTDTCNPASGCVFTNNTNPCSDGNACTTGDTCGGGTCHPGSPTVCNDNNPCTTDTCNPASGCVFTPDDSNTCTDGDICTTDTCSSGACVHSPSGLCGVSGVVRYYRDDTGTGSEPSTKGVPATGIDRTNDAVADATTDASGAYNLGSLVGNVTVKTVNKYGSPRAADANGAITALDASFVARGRVGLLSLSPNQVLAGDVTGDGSLSALDASEIARYAVHLVDHFDVATTANSDWKYLRCDNYVFPGNPGCVAPVYNYTPVTHAQPDTNFYALLYGDVTGNWQPSSFVDSAKRSAAQIEEDKAAAADLALAATLAQKAPASVQRAAGAAPAELSIAPITGTMRAGEKRQLTITLKDAEGILGLDLSLKYDPAQIAIVDMASTGIASDYAVWSKSSDGKTEVAAYGLLPLSGSGQAFTITVQALKPGVRGVPVTVDARANEGRIPIQVHNGSTKAPASRN